MVSLPLVVVVGIVVVVVGIVVVVVGIVVVVVVVVVVVIFFFLIYCWQLEGQRNVTRLTERQTERKTHE